MKPSLIPGPPFGRYSTLLRNIKDHIRTAQIRAAFAANAEMLNLYWTIGRALTEWQAKEGWGSRLLARLSVDLHNDLPEVKGFSERNLKLMTQFYREYPSFQIGQPPVAQLPWAHNVVLMQRVKDPSTRSWYARRALENGWSRNVLGMMLDGRVHARQGRAVTNFKDRLPSPQSDLARQTLRDPYIFDFLTLEGPFHERELETELLRHLEKFLLELGRGFAFVGRQYHMDVGEDDFYIDLLFYHLRLSCFVVVELKKGSFKAEYAGKMNFYCNVVDAKLKRPTDNPTIGLILCQNKNRMVAEYALKGVDKAIGISNYQLTRALPKRFQSNLPSVDEIENEMAVSSNPHHLKKNRTAHRSRT
jgi:predicted nuclease of restriction endonuclease-like (RecB) superfamily